MVFTFWVLVIIMSVSWLVYLLLNNIDLILQEFLFLVVLVIACVSFSLSMYFIFQIVVDLRAEIKKQKEKQRSIQDVYNYNNLLDPPSMFT